MRIIGFDGLEPTLLYPNLDRFPNFRAAVERGLSGRLATTQPPITPVAIATFATGLSPQEHGILSAFKTPTGGFVNYEMIRGRTFWDALNRAGISVSVIAVPLTYRPFIEKGYMISGFLTPPGALTYYYPGWVRAYARPFGDFSHDLKHHTREEHEALLKREFDPAYWWAAARAQAEAMLRLQQEHPTDVQVWYFSFTDFISHHCWHDRDVMLQTYAVVDEILGRIQGDVNLVFSDHGFGDILGPECEHYRQAEDAVFLSQYLSGGHSDYGIFLAYGRGIAHGTLEDAAIGQIGATVCHWLGVTFPGEPLDIAELYTPAEQRAIEDQLTSLGYIA